MVGPNYLKFDDPRYLEIKRLLQEYYGGRFNAIDQLSVDWKRFGFSLWIKSHEDKMGLLIGKNGDAVNGLESALNRSNIHPQRKTTTSVTIVTFDLTQYK